MANLTKVTQSFKVVTVNKVTIVMVMPKFIKVTVRNK